MLLPLTLAVSRPGPRDLTRLSEDPRDALPLIFVVDMENQAAILIVELHDADTDKFPASSRHSLTLSNEIPFPGKRSVRLGQPYPLNFYSLKCLALPSLRSRFGCTPSRTRSLP